MSQPNYPSHRRRSISPQRWVVWRASGKPLRLAGFLHGLRKCPTRLRTPITPLIAYVRFGLHGFFLLELLLSGLVIQTPWLLVVAVSALLIEVVLRPMISLEHSLW